MTLSFVKVISCEYTETVVHVRNKLDRKIQRRIKYAQNNSKTAYEQQCYKDVCKLNKKWWKMQKHIESCE